MPPNAHHGKVFINCELRIEIAAVGQVKNWLNSLLPQQPIRLPQIHFQRRIWSWKPPLYSLKEIIKTFGSFFVMRPSAALCIQPNMCAWKLSVFMCVRLTRTHCFSHFGWFGTLLAYYIYTVLNSIWENTVDKRAFAERFPRCDKEVALFNVSKHFQSLISNEVISSFEDCEIKICTSTHQQICSPVNRGTRFTLWLPHAFLDIPFATSVAHKTSHGV